MQSLVIFSCLIAATLAVTPFFESPDNEHAAAFYKKPAGLFAPVESAPVYKPAPVLAYEPAPVPVYKPVPVPVYKPAPVPVYKPAPVLAYEPAPVPSYKPEPYKAPEYKSDYGHGATSYQKINLDFGESAYKPEYKPQY